MAGQSAGKSSGQSGQALRKAAISGQAGAGGRAPRKVALAKATPKTAPAAPNAARKAVGGAAPDVSETVQEVALALGLEGTESTAGEGRAARPPLKSVVLQPMSSFGKQLAMRPHGRAVQQEIDSLLRSLPPESVLVIDFEGVEMMDYSFADEALGAIFSRLSAKEYPNRYIVLAAGEGDLAEALIENVEVALARREVAALVLPKDGIEEPDAGGEPSEPSAPGKRGAMPVVLKADAGEWRVAGTLPQHLVETLRAVMDRQQVTVRELADELHIDSATACNNRIARLYQLRLVRREAAIVPEGGRQYFYSSVI
jgi:hypothetical protein